VVGEHAVRREQPARRVIVQRAVALGAPEGRGRRRQRVLPRHARRVVVPAAAAVPPHRLGLPRTSASRQKSDEAQLHLTHLTLTLNLPYPPGPEDHLCPRRTLTPPRRLGLRARAGAVGRPAAFRLSRAPSPASAWVLFVEIEWGAG